MTIKGTDPESKLEDTEEVLSYLFNATNAGAFCDLESSPMDCKLEVIPQNNVNVNELKYTLHVESIHPSVWRILLHMLTQTHYKLDQLAEVNLISENSEINGLNDLFKIPFPARAKDVPFSLEIYEQLDQQTEFAIRFEFDKEVEENLLTEVTERLVDLSGIIYLGGFFDSVQELEEPQLSDDPETYCSSPNTILHYLRAWNADFIALECFINLAIRFHYSLCPILSLEFE